MQSPNERETFELRLNLSSDDRQPTIQQRRKKPKNSPTHSLEFSVFQGVQKGRPVSRGFTSEYLGGKPAKRKPASRQMSDVEVMVVAWLSRAFSPQRPDPGQTIPVVELKAEKSLPRDKLLICHPRPMRARGIEQRPNVKRPESLDNLEDSDVTESPSVGPECQALNTQYRVPRGVVHALANPNGSTPLGSEMLSYSTSWCCLQPGTAGPLGIYVLFIVMSFQPYLIRCSDTVHSDIHSGLRISDLQSSPCRNRWTPGHSQ
jgi:hypothetical protein